ncbi:MAG: discoidin domain-containing protein [Opitutales bacterium]
MKRIFANTAVLIAGLVLTGFTRPEYAPAYVPPVATGEARVAVGLEGVALAGTWTLRLDDEKNPMGLREAWYEESRFENKIDLPNAIQNAGFGSPVTVDTEWMGVSGYHLWFTEKYDKYREPDNIKVPFFLQPERRFIGDAWFQKTIQLEEAPAGKDLILRLERPHWSTTVWLNGEKIGDNNSLGLPHVYTLGRDLKPGEYNPVVKVNNTLLLPVGSRAHSVSDETQGAWNGIIGDLDLSWRSPVYLKHVKITTRPDDRSADVRVLLENLTNSAHEATIDVGGKIETVRAPVGESVFKTNVSFGSNAKLWSEFSPVLHDLGVSLKTDWGVEEESFQVGLRKIEVDGNRFLINGYETFMRGTLDCAIFPKTGYPPMDKASWLEHLGKMKASGINHVRFHSWCPPKAAFEAGDELGMYLLPEIHIWGDPSNKAFDGWVLEEGKRIIDRYGNHPSFIFFTHGNEPWRGEANSTFLAQLTQDLKAYDDRMLHTASANTIQSEHDEFTLTTRPRGPSGWKGKGFDSKHTLPFIQHEPGQWTAYPNFGEMVKYTGPLKPKNFEIFLEQAEENGVLPQWEDFLHASGKLQMLCYKEDCEAALASEGIAGTQLLGISDFSGQGTSLVGYLDVFLDEKGYFSKEDFFRFWNWSVPLARMSSYVFEQSDTLTAPVIYAWFGQGTLTNQTLIWEITDASGSVIKSGAFDELTLSSGRTRVGDLSVDLASFKAPANYTLTLKLKGTDTWNSWDFIVCEDEPEVDLGAIAVFNEVNAEMEAALARCDSVLLMPHDYSLAHPNLSFTPVYWNKFLFSHNTDRVTLGALIENEHPLFNTFPTENHVTWNWEKILDSSYGLAMENLPSDGMIMQPIDDWNRNRRLGFIFEYKIGPGKLLVSMADLFAQKADNPAAHQLLSSMLQYMNSEDFDPEVEANIPDLNDALRYASNKSTMLSLGASVKKVSHAWKRSEGQAIDGDTATNWNGKFTGQGDHITIDLGEERTLQGILLTRTNLKNFEVYLGNDLKALEPVPVRDADGNIQATRTLDKASMEEAQKIGFEGEATGRYLKIQINSVYGNTIRLNEMDVIFVIF